MIHYFRLRDGIGEHAAASQGTIPLRVLRGRSLSRPFKSMPTYGVAGTVGPANSLAEPNAIAILTDDPVEARQLGAVPGHYHLVLDFTPWHLDRAVAALHHATRTP